MRLKHALGELLFEPSFSSWFVLALCVMQVEHEHHMDWPLRAGSAVVFIAVHVLGGRWFRRRSQAKATRR